MWKNSCHEIWLHNNNKNCEQRALAYLPCFFLRIGFNVVNILLGELPLTKNNKVVNFIILCSKQYLFTCLKKGKLSWCLSGLLFHLFNKYKAVKILNCIHLLMPGNPGYLFLTLLLNNLVTCLKQHFFISNFGALICLIIFLFYTHLVWFCYVFISVGEGGVVFCWFFVFVFLFFGIVFFLFLCVCGCVFSI